MEYNQYWNEIKSEEENVQNREDNEEKSVVSFTYNEVIEEPENIFDDDEDDDEELLDEEDDSKMYSNSSLFELIDEIEETEEAERAERLNQARFVNFDFKDDNDADGVDAEEKDVHIFAEELEAVLNEDDEDSVPVQKPEPEMPVEEPVVEQVEEPVAEQVEEPAAEQVEVPHFESPKFEDKEETDIDRLIEEAKKKEEESSQKKLLESELLPLLKDIISFMPANCAFVDYIAQLSNDDRKDLVRVIEKARNAWLEDKSDKMFTIPEGNVSICVLSDITDPMREVQRLENVGAQMFSYEKEEWGFVKLYFNQDSKLLRASVSTINRDSFNSWQWKVVQQAGFNLWKSRQ